MTTLAQRLEHVRLRVAQAVQRRGGHPLTLVGVSKRQPIDKLHDAVAAGLFDFGENYAQELRDKRKVFTDPRARWHFIGPVQTNKVKYVVGSHCIHTVDRPELLEAIEGRAARQGVEQSVLVQVNLAHEAQKHGAASPEVPGLLDRFADLDHVHCAGLMLIPPVGTPEQTRAHFAQLRKLRDALAATARPRVELRELSMGMSADFEEAIAEGATMIRVGTSIFGPRPA